MRHQSGVCAHCRLSTVQAWAGKSQGGGELASKPCVEQLSNQPINQLQCLASSPSRNMRFGNIGEWDVSQNCADWRKMLLPQQLQEPSHRIFSEKFSKSNSLGLEVPSYEENFQSCSSKTGSIPECCPILISIFSAFLVPIFGRKNLTKIPLSHF